MEAGPDRNHPYIEPGRVSIVRVSTNSKGPGFAECTELRRAEGLNFPQAAVVERLIGVVDGCYEDHETRSLELDEGDFHMIIIVLVGDRSCEGRNFSKMRMTVP